MPVEAHQALHSAAARLLMPLQVISIISFQTMRAHDKQYKRTRPQRQVVEWPQ